MTIAAARTISATTEDKGIAKALPIIAIAPYPTLPETEFRSTRSSSVNSQFVVHCLTPIMPEQSCLLHEQAFYCRVLRAASA